jgi:pyruvate dehydrogenase E1 component alpha subunit
MGRADGFEPEAAYRMILRMRLAEEVLVDAWDDGLVSGEYHSGIGEEGINAGVVLHLQDGDTLALDYRCTGPLVARGVELEPLMLEVLGSEAGMNRGRAGHMHLMARELSAVADGIVGSSAALAVGQAVALARTRPGAVAVAFHGEGAMNQGMLMEAYNLAVVWRLPVVFVCRDNRWSITTRSREVTAGTPTGRARSFGLAVEEAKGHDVRSVHAAAGRLVARARRGEGPGFLHATCFRPGGHFEGDPMLRMLRHPVQQVGLLRPGLQAALLAAEGGATKDRGRGLSALVGRFALAARDRTAQARKDPVRRTRRLLDPEDAAAIERDEQEEVQRAMEAARGAVSDRPVVGPRVGGPP